MTYFNLLPTKTRDRFIRNTNHMKGKQHVGVHEIADTQKITPRKKPTCSEVAIEP